MADPSNSDPGDYVPLNDSDGVDFGTILALIADDVEYISGTPTAQQLSPTEGRIAVDTVSDTVYLGTGDAWQEASAGETSMGSTRSSSAVFDPQTAAPAAPENGMVVYDANNWSGVGPGFVGYEEGAWVSL